MRIVLFSMPDTVPHFMHRAWRVPSLANGLLAGNTPGHEVFLADLVLRRDDVPGAVREVMRTYKPDLVGCSAMGFQYDTARHVARLVKKEFPRVKTLLGGYHATLLYLEVSEGEDGPLWDFIARNEGDHLVKEIADALERGSDLAEIKGITFRADGAVHHNAPGVLLDLDEIHFPKRDARIWTGYGYYTRPVDVIETSRGCVMACTFCSMQKMYGKTFRKYSLDRVIADIRDAHQHGIRCLLVSDDNITLDIPRFIELLKRIVKEGLNDIFYIVQASSHGIASSPELCQWLDKANWRIVFLGIENVSARALKHMKKGDIVERTRTACRQLHDNRVMIVGGMIIGFPWDGVDEIRENYEFFEELDIDFFGDQIITPYPKTVARDQQIPTGLVVNKSDFRYYDGYWANVRTESMTADEMLFQRWRYRNKFSTFWRTTKAFKENFPKISLLRDVWGKPSKRVKSYFRNRGLSEREIFEREMTSHIMVNNFFGDREPYRPFDEVYRDQPDIVLSADSIPTPGGKDAISDWQRAIDVYSSSSAKGGSGA